MPNLVVVGAQWGDEGKGKVVDFLARTASMVARFQGGPNAGHTVWINGRKAVLHQIPSGILTRGVRCVIGCGCVIDPYVLLEEIAELRKFKLTVGRRLAVDFRAHLILPYHRLLDRLRDEHSGRQRIGTTGRGIGPAYQDKYGRVGIRVQDVISEEVFRDKVKRNLAAANFVLMEHFKADPLSPKSLLEDYWKATRILAKMIDDGSTVVEQELSRGGRVLFEGAQGVHLDLDLGTYPYVTTSSTGAWGVAPGLGISPLWLEETIGVAKAYTTRVGEGPFPTELGADEAEELRRLGGEYGATTGRPRRCGWFDVPVVRTSVRHNRLSALVITKLDVLDSLKQLQICTEYSLLGRTISEFDSMHADRLEPRYITMPGWRQPTSQCRKFSDLPLAARRYLRKVEELVGCPIALVSVGKERSEMIQLRPRVLQWFRSQSRS
ncbi:MAG: adenylosuccinate synthase [candidate division WOR-3 bacterium]